MGIPVFDQRGPQVELGRRLPELYKWMEKVICIPPTIVMLSHSLDDIALFRINTLIVYMYRTRVHLSLPGKEGLELTCVYCRQKSTYVRYANVPGELESLSADTCEQNSQKVYLHERTDCRKTVQLMKQTKILTKTSAKRKPSQ